MTATAHSKNSLEPLEARIAPASAIATGIFTSATVGDSVVLHAGEGLSTSSSNSGTYLLYVEQGQCRVFTTDLNNNGSLDFNEITGIAAGDGLRLISFVNIYGDIVTNLRPNGLFLSDSDNNSSNDDPVVKGDGRVLLNSTIEKIELRSLTVDDLNDQNGDGIVDENDVLLRMAMSSYSIFGTVYAGKGFGVEGDATSGLIIDDTGRALQQQDFGTGLGLDYFYDFKPSISFIKTGTASNGEYFSFGISRKNDTQGLFTTFITPDGQHGGDIIGVRAANSTLTFNIDGLVAGDGGKNARGGNIKDVTLNGDTAGGYVIQAGTGGRGANGGNGGSIANFQDFSSFTSQIVIRSGDGGAASTGVGGNGGNISFGTLNVNGGLGITLGSGGDGFSAGGNGASLTKAVISTPESPGPTPLYLVGAVHDPLHDPATGLATQIGGIIGRSLPLDFDHDGFGDIVFTSSNPGQLVVDFGDGTGGFRNTATNTSTDIPGALNRIYLPVGDVPDALTVGDFNGDGFYDIASASHSDGNFGGISVYLAKTEDTNADGILTRSEDIDHDGVVDFLGFQAPRFSPLPTLGRGDSAGGVILDSSYLYRRSAVPISALAAGDFNGDGITDLAVVASYTKQGIDIFQTQVLIFLTGDVENGRPTGHFFADVGTKATSTQGGANPLVPFFPLDGFQFIPGTDAVIEATSLSTADGHDVIVGSGIDTRSKLNLFDNSQPSIVGPAFNVSPNARVDSDRGDGISLVPVFVRDMMISDTNNDGFADATILSSDPNPGFAIAELGNGSFSSTDPFPDIAVGGGGNNSGAYFPDPFYRSLIPADGSATSLVIRNASFSTSGVFDQVVIGFSGISAGAFIFDVANATNGGGDANFPVLARLGIPSFDPSAVVVDPFFPRPGDQPNAVTYIYGNGNSLVNRLEFQILGDVEVAEHYIVLNAGDGGDALVGRGGVGGNLGDPAGAASHTDPVTGAVDPSFLGLVNVTIPETRTFSGIVQFFGGNGGNGFSSGGKGGGVSGMQVRYAGQPQLIFHSEVSIFGGNGGFGVAGAGGSGGDITANTLQGGGRGTFLTGGRGGNGTVGGSGGTIRGNGNLFDSQDADMILHAGAGGNGVRAGGAGGDIVNFRGLFDLSFQGETGGLLQHIAGDGGNSISGPGGRGGNVVGSSPIEGENKLAGNIVLIGGHGGNGRSGGNGGSVLDFVDRPSDDNPAVLSFIAGNGGKGTSGRGGNGGDVANIESPSVGAPNPFSGLFFDPRVTPMPYTFNRFLAGDAGKSAGAVGGNGGSVHDIVTSNSEGPLVMVSGAGGSGLFRGGNGGSLRDLTFNLGSDSLNKALFIAGAGGSAAAWKPNPLNPGATNQEAKFFGGTIGKAGNGGNIVNLTQDGSGGARVDLIAGNGGDLLNYGSISNTNLPVGKGGSILNVHVDGSIGNIGALDNTNHIVANIPLKSYNDVLGGETLQNFVTVNLRDPLVPGSFDDSVGMVGLVAGAAGRLKQVSSGFNTTNEVNYRSVPAKNGINGSVTGLEASNIASMIAGAVERIAAIRVVSGIKLSPGGILGMDFNDNIDPTPYRDPDGNPIIEPVLDGQLVDGALVYRQFSPTIPPLPTSPRIFQLGQQTPRHT
jgi:hypothetical protein